MKKSILLMNLATFFLLLYYAVTRGIDAVLGAALVISVVSNALNVLCEVKHGRKKD